MRGRFLLAACTAIATIFAVPASASVVYKYDGNNYDRFIGTLYDTSMSVTGTLELAAPLPPDTTVVAAPISFSFSDGVHTFTELNTFQRVFQFGTDMNGAITSWQIFLNQLFPIAIGNASAWNLSSAKTPTGTVDSGTVFICTSIDSSGDCAQLEIVEQATVPDNPGGVVSRSPPPSPLPLRRRLDRVG